MAAWKNNSTARRSAATLKASWSPRISCYGFQPISISQPLLGCSADEAERAGTLWSLADGAQHCSDAPSRGLLASRAGEALAAIAGPLPRKLRPLTVIAALAAVDLLRDAGGLARLSVAFRHRLAGVLPRS